MKHRYPLVNGVTHQSICQGIVLNATSEEKYQLTFTEYFHRFLDWLRGREPSWFPPRGSTAAASDVLQYQPQSPFDSIEPRETTVLPLSDMVNNTYEVETEPGKLIEEKLDIQEEDGAEKALLDIPFMNLDIFSVRATNALLRSGIITLRLLLPYSPELLQSSVRNLGEHSLEEIEQNLAEHGLRLAADTLQRQVLLQRCVTQSFGFGEDEEGELLEFEQLLTRTNEYRQRLPIRSQAWTAEEVAEEVKNHPYVHASYDGRYYLQIVSIRSEMPAEHSLLKRNSDDNTIARRHVTSMHAPQQMSLEDSSGIQNSHDEDRSTLPSEGDELDVYHGFALCKLWSGWLAQLDARQVVVLSSLYGMDGDDPQTLQEVGEELDVTRERVRQVKEKALQRLRHTFWSLWNPLEATFAESVRQSHYLMTLDEWEMWLDEHTTWESNEPRPQLMRLLCDVFSEFRYSNRYQIATAAHIQEQDLIHFEKAITRLLRQRRDTGVTLEEVIVQLSSRMRSDLPSLMLEQPFVEKAIGCFPRVHIGQDGQCHYLSRQKPSRRTSSTASWAGKPGTELHRLEQQLRNQLQDVDWIGQFTVTEADFAAMCDAIRKEAVGRNYFTKVLEAQPKLVPSAIFMTTMVFSTRYAETLPDESVDEFWAPYFRTVWGVSYSQAFYSRCRKRFDSAVGFLQDRFGFVFPSSDGSSEVVTPVFRHALIPRYMQSDFATWIKANWRSILVLPESPAELAASLQYDQSLNQGNYSERLKHFILGPATSETAAALIRSMSAAIDLYVNQGESIESIDSLLIGNPIERELWQEISSTFGDETAANHSSSRVTRPRLTWVWSVDESEVALRVQNVVLQPSKDIEGEPDRLLWIEEPDDEPDDAAISVSVIPWRMASGERVIPDLFIAEPDGPEGGELLLLTDMDEVVLRLRVPPHPKNKLQFFRITQQGAYGMPIDFAQVKEGSHLVCATRPVRFFEDPMDDESELEEYALEADFELAVPYPLDQHYEWAAQLTLDSPTLVVHGSERIRLAQPDRFSALQQVSIVGKAPVNGLSRQSLPVFSSTEIALCLKGTLHSLTGQTHLVINGQSGWRVRQSLVRLVDRGCVEDGGEAVQINLSTLLPNEPDLYTLELLSGVHSVMTPLQIAVVPDLVVTVLSDEDIYTPVQPFIISLQGVESHVIVRNDTISVTVHDESGHRIQWLDYRQDPKLLLRFEMVDIPLGWSVPQFTVWLEPKPTKRFLTLHEMRHTVLHALARHADVNQFEITLADQGSRQIRLQRGRYRSQLGQTVLYDMVKLSKDVSNVVFAKMNGTTWPIFEVRRRPELAHVSVHYEHSKQNITVVTGLSGSWAGSVRFLARSLTNPFVSDVMLKKQEYLGSIHSMGAALPDGVYTLLIELDSALIPLAEDQTRFNVGDAYAEVTVDRLLTEEIRNGTLISHELAEDFVLQWADLASRERIALTPPLMYQLATLPSLALSNFTAAHLGALWEPLKKLKTVTLTKDWYEQYGLLPAWIFNTTPIILRTLDRGYKLRIYPMLVAEGGIRGKGYGRWRVFGEEGSPKEFVYVQWQPHSDSLVQIEAGLPETIPDEWATVELEDTYGLHYCIRCGRLVGSHSYAVSDEIVNAHLHGHKEPDLREITTPEKYGGYRLLAEVSSEQNGTPLTSMFETFNVAFPGASAYMPVPLQDVGETLPNPAWCESLAVLARELIAYSQYSTSHSPCACALRLQEQWGIREHMEHFDRLIAWFGLLLRIAGHAPTLYLRILRNSGLTEDEISSLLGDLMETYSDRIEWGLIWAELLIMHSSEPLR